MSVVPPDEGAKRVTSVGPPSLASVTTAADAVELRAPSREGGDDIEVVAESFDSYYRRDYRKLVGLAYVLTGSQWAAEDLAQDALTEAHRKWSTIQDYDDPEGWVRRVMVNKSTSRVRRLRTEAKGLVRMSGRRVEQIAPTERSLEVWTAVRDLPARQSQVIALYYWEDRPIAQVAMILGMSTETVKTHLKRARASLAIKLDSHRGEAE